MRTRSTAFAGLALAAALTLTACGHQNEDTTAADARSATPSASSSGATTAASSGASGASSSGSAHSGGTGSAQGGALDDPVDAAHNEADMTFAHMMIPHHEQAVRMGEIMAKKDGVRQPVADIAARIKDEQAPEVRRLNEMLDTWGNGSSTSNGHGAMSRHPGMEMDGMLSQEQMRQLEQADAQQAAHLYVSQMIGHHKGAIAMAEAELRDGENPQALALATAIIEAQEGEVQELMAMPEAQ